MTATPSSPVIHKTPARQRVAPNLESYEAATVEFSWVSARTELDGLPGGRGLNIAHEAVDRHARGPRSTAIALRCLGRSRGADTSRDITYAELAALSNRFANVLTSLGVAKGERVFALAPRVPELYVAALGAWKAQAVFCPLFAAFGPEPIQTRMTLGDARVLVTTTALYRRKVAPLRPSLPRLAAVLLIDDDGAAAGHAAGVHSVGLHRVG